MTARLGLGGSGDTGPSHEDPCGVESRMESWWDRGEGQLVVYLVCRPLLQGTVSYNPVLEDAVPEGRTTS